MKKSKLRILASVLIVIQIIMMPNTINYTMNAINNKESVAYIIGTLLGGLIFLWISLYLIYLAKKRK